MAPGELTMFNNSFQSVLPNMAMDSESKAWTHISWSFLDFLSSEKNLGMCLYKIWRFIFVFDEEHSGNKLLNKSTLSRVRLVFNHTDCFVNYHRSHERMERVLKRAVLYLCLCRDLLDTQHLLISSMYSDG